MRPWNLSGARGRIHSQHPKIASRPAHFCQFFYIFSAVAAWCLGSWFPRLPGFPCSGPPCLDRKHILASRATIVVNTTSRQQRLEPKSIRRKCNYTLSVSCILGPMVSGPFWIIQTPNLPMAVTKVFIRMTLNISERAAESGKQRRGSRG